MILWEWQEIMKYPIFDELPPNPFSTFKNFNLYSKNKKIDK